MPCFVVEPANWIRPPGKPIHNWLGAVEKHQKSLNFGFATDWR